MNDFAVLTFKADARPLEDARQTMSGVAKEAKETKRATDALGKGFDETGRRARGTKKATDEMNKGLGETTRRSRETKRATDEVNKGFDETSRRSRKATDEIRKQRDEFGRFIPAAGGAGAALGKLDRLLGFFGKKITGLTKNLGAFGTSLLAAFGVGAATFGLASMLNTLSEFEYQMSTVAAVSGATGDTLKSLRTTAKLLGSTTEFSANQAAGGLKLLVQAGYNAEEAIATIPAVLNLATTEAMDLGTATEYVNSIMAGFGLTVADAARVTDVLVYASNAASTGVAELGEGMKFVAPVSASLGISIEDTAAALGLLSDAGLKGGQAGTSLRTVLASLASPTKMAVTELTALGVAASEVNPATTSIVDIVNRLADANLDAAGAFKVFGREAAPAMLALIANKDKLEEMTGSMSEVAGEAQRIADYMRDNLRGSMQGLASVIEALVIAFGEAGLTAVLRSVIDGLTFLISAAVSVVNVFGNLFKMLANPVFEFLAKHADTLKSALIGVAAAVTTYYIPAVLRAMGSTAIWAATTIPGLIAALISKGIALDLVITKMITLRGALMATGFGAIVVLVGMAANAFINLAEKAGGLGKAFELLGEVAGLVWKGIVDSAKAIPPGLSAIWENIKGEFFALLVTMQTAWTNFVRNLAGIAAVVPGMGAFEEGLNAAADRTLGKALESTAAMNAAYAASAAAAKNSAKTITDAFAPVAAKMDELLAASEDMGEVTETVIPVVEDLGVELGDLGDSAGGAGKETKKATDELKNAKGAAGLLSEELRNHLTKAVEGVSNAFADFIMRGLKDFSSFAKSIIDTFKQMLTQMIAMAAKNRIIIGLGLDPLSQALGLAGAPVGPLAGGMGGGLGGGLLGGAIGGWGNATTAGTGLLGGLGGVWRGISGGFASGGIMGGISGGIGASLSGISAGLSAGGLAGIASAIGAAVPILAGVAAVISIGKKLFGRKLKDTGIEATFSMAEGLAAQTYKFYKGGLFRSNKTKRSPLDEELAAPLERAMTEIGQSVLDMADSLGIAGASLEGLSHSFKFSTKGLSEEQIEQKLNEEFEKFGDAAAEAAVEGLMPLLKQGEKAYDGLKRLSSALETANAAFDMIGKTLYEVSLVGADMASQLADAFGGIEAMGSAVENYFTKFMSEAEQRAYLERSTLKALEEVNQVMPRTRDEYRQMIEGLDLTTESGREAFAVLVRLADAMDMLLPVVNNLSQAIIEAAQGALTNVDLQIQFANTMANDLRRTASEWFSASRAIRDQVRDMRQSDMSGASEAEKLAASAASFRAAVEAAKEGDVDAARSVTGLAQTYIENLRSTSGSAQDFARREAQIRNELNLVAGIAELNGASADVQAQLYENMVTVLEDLKIFLQTQGLSEEALAQLPEELRAMYEDFDGTLASFEGQLAALTSAIEHAESLTYKAIMGEIDVNLDVIAKANIPADVKQLLVAANDGIRATVDFIARTDNMPPDLKWLALTAQSEHAKTVNLLVGRQLPADILRLALADISAMQKTVHLVEGSKLPDDIRRIVLATNSEMAKTINVQLSTNTNLAALRAALTETGAVTRTIHGLVNLGQLTPQQNALLMAISGASAGTITLGGTFRFDPSGAFISWYGATTQNTITNPMNNLRASLENLRSTIAADAAARAAEAAKQQRITAAQANLEKIAGFQQAKINQVEAGIQGIHDLAAKHNVSLKTEKGGPAAWFRVNPNTGLFEFDYDAIGGSSKNIEAFKREFYGTGRVGAWNDMSTVSGQTYGQMEVLKKLAAQLEIARQQVRDVGGVPQFASGGLHSGGLRIVGEQGPEIEATGPSRIWNANMTRNMMGSEVTAELRQLREEVRQFREDNTEGQVQLGNNTRKTADMLRKWDIDGAPAERSGARA